MAGRVVWMGAFEKPAHLRGQQTTIGIKVVDEEQAKKTLAKFVAKYPERFEERKFGDVTYYAFVIDWPEESPRGTAQYADGRRDGRLFLPGRLMPDCSNGRSPPATAPSTGSPTGPISFSSRPRCSRKRRALRPRCFSTADSKNRCGNGTTCLRTEKTKAYLEENAARRIRSLRHWPIRSRRTSCRRST